MVFNKWVKHIQTVVYNGTHTEDKLQTKVWLYDILPNFYICPVHFDPNNWSSEIETSDWSS